jgi:ATP-dependent exoDNAse (exonuclease V) alpha subunit
MNQEYALSILKSGKNVFLTGSAGAGKTYVLNQYIQYLKERKVAIAITASTGIAATHMNGMTIHAWSGIGVKDVITPADLKLLGGRKYMTDKMDLVKVLIIDEISMLHKNQLDMVNTVLKFFKKNSLPFGGVQVILAGDFFQLPPIGSDMQTNKEKFAFMSEAWLEAQLNICYLTEQYRQSDNSLNQILNEMRTGKVSEKSLELLNDSSKNKPNEVATTKLYTHNIDVDRENKMELAAIQDKAKLFTASTKGNETLVQMLKKSVLTDEDLKLKIGAKVMFIKNNYDKDFMNGTLGEVIDYSEDGFPLVKIKSGKIIEAEPEEWKIEDEKGKKLAVFNQVPLRLAWAITVHKSQGMTLDAAEIDLRKTFEKGQGYVALSRLKNIESLCLLGFNETALLMDDLAIKADRRFLELSNELETKYQISELEKEFNPFIDAIGGISDLDEIKKAKFKDKIKSSKKTTYQITQDLLNEGKSLKEIAEERGLAIDSIIGHLSKIKEMDPSIDLEKFKPDAFLISDVHEVVKDLVKDKAIDPTKVQLSPIYNALKGKLSYGEIKLALLYIDLG